MVGLGVVVVGFAVAGVGRGLAYPRLMSQAFNALLGGGLSSPGESVDIAAGPSMSAALALLTGAAAPAWRRSAVA